MKQANLVYSLDISPNVPIGWLAGLAILSAAILAFGIWRNARGSAWRGGLLALLILMLANPVLLAEKRDYLEDVALIIVDESDSQRIGQRKEVTTESYTNLKKQLESFDNLQVETVVVKNKVSSTSRAENGSLLFSSRHDALKNIPPDRIAATIMITDGQIHDIPNIEGLSKSEGPVHFLLSGEKDEKDRVLRLVKAPAFGIVNQPITLVVNVEDFGVKNPIATAKLSVRLDGELMQNRLAQIGEDIEIELSLSHGGKNFVEISVDPLEGELTEKNNTAYVTINGVRDRLQVLLVSGEPHMGERGWRNILKSDPSVDLVHFTILRPPEKQDGTPITELSLIPFPIRDLFEKKLNDFDLIIFDRYRRRGVLPSTYLRNISQYVEEGGALLEAAGPAFATALSLYRTPLSDVLPGRPTGYVFNEGYVPAVSDIGKRHPVTGQLKSDKEGSPEWGRWFRMIEAEALAGQTLMTGPDDQPLLILEKRLNGRVAQLLSDHAWLWGRGFEGGGPQSELLRRVSHWLMKEPELEEEQLSAIVEGDNLVLHRQSLEELPATITVTDPEGNKSLVALSPSGSGIQTGITPITTSGLYKLQHDDQKSLIAVGILNPKELHDLRATADKIIPVAKATGGGVRWLTEQGLPDFRRTKPKSNQASTFWMGLRSNENFEVTGYKRQALLPPLLGLILAMAFLCLGWWREGR
ncbi:hypothetical protein NBZ79_02680 [Sneathiella marina]|uniref:Glutamine amidotransferase domain-containing protein n=1 Tax=Sneathiella marina TaxID=2950108 RepID=A0ABY4W4B4_9PROT|nr:hypothetical protein [Sneathiella marina]USG61878.1 hypothetical protein NBZ79_02680 [Sneathiella marina]